jgi:SAM-dependent methyltransferase
MDELDQIKAAYKRRKMKSDVYNRLGKNIYFILFSEFERELQLTQIAKKNINDLNEVLILEVGAGSGNNLLFFKRLGIKWENMYANELLSERVECLKKDFPLINLLPGDFSSISLSFKFDVIYQSLVFSSMLDENLKRNCANKMWEYLKPGGVILWYDFKFNNPSNKDVKGIKENEVKNLFPEAAQFSFYNVTLAPPLGRFVGRYYYILNVIFPFFRTHYIAIIKKKEE